MNKLTSEMIKARAYELGAQVCGIGGLELFASESPQRDPKSILPAARSIIGFGFAVPRGLYYAMARGSAAYGYTTLGVKYLDEETAEIFLLKMGGLIEDCGYDACLQKAVPNLRVKGDKETNPEVKDTYELIYAEPVAAGKPAPDVIIDFGVAAEACGIGCRGKSGHIISPKYGPFMRYCFIITDALLELDSPIAESLCDGCMECAAACPGRAISESGLDSWQCAVYYKGAHKSNPCMNGDAAAKFLAGDPERDEILDGSKRFDAESARKIYPKLNFLPQTQWGYAPCLCRRACDIACFNHLAKRLGQKPIPVELPKYI